MQIPAITNLLVDCWSEAEQITRGLIRDEHHGATEDQITFLFHGKLRASLDKATKDGRVQDAFQSDVLNAFPNAEFADLTEIASRLRATCTLHEKHTEGETGGDMGLILVRPEGEPFGHDEGEDLIFEEYKRGLLVQAKRGVPDEKGRVKWGDFTPIQKKRLPNRLEYLSILLYEYEDAGRRLLRPFRWLLCSGLKFDKIRPSIKKGKALLPSGEVLIRLGNDEIGTDDKKIIATYIEAEVPTYFVIHIGWPRGDGLRERALHSVRSEQKEKQRLKVYN